LNEYINKDKIIFRTKIFLSCGQNKDEKPLVGKIKKYLESKNYEVYVATTQQKLKGLKDNIFNELSTSEYFLFIDFKRERIISKKRRNDNCRGSLFSHQELAIASFLDMELIALHEKGTINEDGISKYIQTNPVEFDDRNKIILILKDLLIKNNWVSGWKNELTMAESKGYYMKFKDSSEIAKFYHVNIFNNHKNKIARNCYAYIKNIKDLSKNMNIEFETTELKWAGYGALPFVTIMPKTTRKIDAFYIKINEPIKLHFNIFTDSVKNIPLIDESGDYEMIYQVISDNFIPIESKFLLHLDNELDKSTFQKFSN
jgi:hypothetical protein